MQHISAYYTSSVQCLVGLSQGLFKRVIPMTRDISIKFYITSTGTWIRKLKKKGFISQNCVLCISIWTKRGYTKLLINIYFIVWLLDERNIRLDRNIDSAWDWINWAEHRYSIRQSGRKKSTKLLQLFNSIYIFSDY